MKLYNDINTNRILRFLKPHTDYQDRYLSSLLECTSTNWTLITIQI